MDTQTKTYKLFDLYPDLAREFAQKLHVKKEDVEYVQKFYASDKSEFNTADRSLTSHITTSSVDRDNEVLLPKGMKAERYEKSGKPVFWGHQYDEPNDIIGQCQWLKMDAKADGIVAKTAFRNNEFADEVYRLYTEDLTGQGPILRGFSVGFIPISWETGKKESDPRRTYTEWELLEYSCVSIPCNPDAQTILAQKGLNLCERLKKDLGLEEAAPIEEKAIEPVVAEPAAPVEKALDLKGNPSVWDIEMALMSTLMDGLEPGGVGRGIVDLYPIDYPNGNCIIGEWGGESAKYFQHKYRYADGVATLADNPVEVAAGYVRKEWEEKRPVHEEARAWERIENKVSALMSDINDQACVLGQIMDRLEVEDAVLIAEPPVPAPAPIKAEVTAPVHIIEITEPTPEEKASREAVKVLKDYIASGALKGMIQATISEQLTLAIDKARGKVY